VNAKPHTNMLMPEAGRIHGSRRNRKHEQMDDGAEFSLGGAHAAATNSKDFR